MIVNSEERHYTAIKNISRLLSKLNGKTKLAYHYCINFLNGFRTESSRDKHYEYCSSNGQVKVNMPNEREKWLRFHDRQYQFKVPFIVYADFESLLKPPVDEWYRDKMNKMKAERKGKTSYTEKINIHVPTVWCVHSTFAYGYVPDPLKMYQGTDCVKKFVEYIEEKIKRLYATFSRQPMIELTDELKREHKATERFHICLKEFNDPQKKKVRDHCHYKGLYRGAVHNNCNQKYQIPGHIPIDFRNLSGYDAHLFIKELKKRFNKNNVGVVLENKEKYISFNVTINFKLAGVSNKDGTEMRKNIQLRFIDSCRFMALSLDNQCKHLRDFYKEGEVLRLMRRKGLYPYENMDSWKKFEGTSLSPKDAFYSRINMKGISDQDFEHAYWNRIT